MLLCFLFVSLFCCACMQFAFTELPKYHFDLRLLGGNMTSLPFIEDWLDGVIGSLLEPYTLPEKVRKPYLL